MKFSVIMPVRNAETTLRLALVSTLAAMPKTDCELIVGLHNSTDSSDAIAQALSIEDSRLRIVGVTGETLGQALNSLVSISRGQYIARMDADDICLPWRFRWQFRIISKRDYDLLFSTAVLFGPALPFPKVFPQYFRSLDTAKGKRLLAFISPFVHPTLLGKKSALEKLGMYRNCAGEDLDLWLRATNSDLQLYRHWLPTILYRVHQSQLSRESSYQDSWKRNAFILTARQQIFDESIGSRIRHFKGSPSLLIFALRYPLTFLEALGLPGYSNFRRLAALWKSYVMRSSAIIQN